MTSPTVSKPTNGGPGAKEHLVFAAALERPAEERAAFLDEACQGDEALRMRLEQLLKAHDEANSLLDVGEAPTLDQLPAPGETICLWDAETGAFQRRYLGHTNVINALAFSPDSRTLASGGSKGVIKLWRVETALL